MNELVAPKIARRLKNAGFAGVVALIFALGGMIRAVGQNVIINEFMAVNDAGLADAGGDFPDWIELHNQGSAPVSLLGWALTDDPAQLSRWRFPAVTVAANGYLVIFASGKDRAVAGGELHTNFKLDGDGEFLALVRPDGITVASQFAPRFPNQRKNISYGLGMDGTAHFFRPPTPGALNCTSK